jgi:hypothetical protein
MSTFVDLIFLASVTTFSTKSLDGILNMGVSDFLKPADELSACKNVYVYQLGKLEKV